MNKLIISGLFIFDLNNKLAKRVDFNDGVNIITSEKVGGNDLGKSVLLKSIYHTLGADSIFDDMWKSEPKVYIVNMKVNKKEYYVYRFHKTFKIFTSELRLIFKTSNRMELSAYLKEIYNFCVKLPNKKEEDLEIAPPAFSYLLNYVDQDYMSGSKFTSFDSLGQYSDFKLNLIYNHLGIFNDEYFRTTKSIEVLKKKEKSLLEEKNILESMLEKVKKYLDDMDVPGDVESLKLELESNKNDYTKVVESLKKAKNSLISLRNQQIDLEMSLEELMLIKKKKEKEIKIVDKNICPTCSQDIENEGKAISVRITEHNELEDYYILKSQLDEMLLEIKRKLSIQEEKYKGLLKRFEKFQQLVEVNTGDVSDVLKHRGYIQTRDHLIKDLNKILEEVAIKQGAITEFDKILEKYKELKTEANRLYEEYMIESITHFGLKEINLNKVKKMRNNFIARGSNIPIATIIWYLNLLKVKNNLNGDSIKFPIVLDSPNNVELDDTKRQALFNYIFANKDSETQLILSTLGFDKNDYNNVKFSKIIKLTNNKYELLNKEDFNENESLLEKVIDA